MLLESEVRERIRERGVDPVRDRDAVRVLVDEAVAAFQERALVGAVAPLEDEQATAKALMDAVAGLGPLQRYLDDPEVEGNRRL